MEKNWDVCEISGSCAVPTAKIENRIEGFFSEIAWGLMQSLAEILTAVLAEQFDKDPNMFHITQAFVENTNNVIPCVRISLSDDDGIPVDEARQTIEAVSAFLTSRHPESQPDFFLESSLPSAESIAHMNTYLEKNGSKRIPTALRITVDKVSVAEISGRFAERPSDTIKNNEILSARGIVVMLNAEKRIVECKAEVSGARSKKLKVAFSEDFLVELANYLGHKRKLELRYAEVLDATGKKFFDLRDVSSCTSPESSSSDFVLQSDA